MGHATAPQGGTGCTVLLGPFRGAVEVLGMAASTRQFDALDPRHLVPQLDALLLTGGSAFGLAAADGVAAWLAEQGLRFDTGIVRVAATALPRRIDPVGTPFDGDLVLGLTTARETSTIAAAESLALGVALRDLLEEEITRAVTEGR